MHALTFHAPGDIRYERVPDPILLEPTDALVRVEVAGVCGSDLHSYHGLETGLDAGTVMGHEFVGEVLEVGAEVRGIRKGQRVLSPFTTSCGDCFYCRGGLSARCERGQLFGWVERGVGLQGAQAQLVRVPLADGTLHAVPAELRPEVAMLFGDVLATGWHCARMGGVGRGDVCAVVGCGPVGLMAALAAREMGAERVFALDPVAERRAHALRLGADTALAPGPGALEAVREATGGRGADCVLEAVGSPASAVTAFELVRPGGTLAVVGVHHEPGFPFSPGQAYDRNLTYRIGRCPARSLLPEILPRGLENRYDLGSLFTHPLPLSEGPGAYGLFARREQGCIKVILHP